MVATPALLLCVAIHRKPLLPGRLCNTLANVSILFKEIAVGWRHKTEVMYKLRGVQTMTALMLSSCTLRQRARLLRCFACCARRAECGWRQPPHHQHQRRLPPLQPALPLGLLHDTAVTRRAVQLQRYRTVLGSRTRRAQQARSVLTPGQHGTVAQGRGPAMASRPRLTRCLVPRCPAALPPTCSAAVLEGSTCSAMLRQPQLAAACSACTRRQGGGAQAHLSEQSARRAIGLASD